MSVISQMDNSSSSNSAMDDASMDDSEPEPEYDYDLEDPDAHEDYEDIPDDDDDDEDMDDDEHHSTPRDLSTTLSGVVNELRFINRPDLLRSRDANGFHLDHFESSLLSFPREEIFRDLLFETMQSLSPTEHVRMQEHLHNLRSIDVSPAEPLGMVMAGLRPSPPNLHPRMSHPSPAGLHPALHRPQLPPSPEAEVTMVALARHGLRPSPFEAIGHRESISHSSLVEAVDRLHRCVSDIRPNQPSDRPTSLRPRPLTVLEDSDLLRSVTIGTNHASETGHPFLTRGRGVERWNPRDREREKVPSSVARRWSYDPQSSGGDTLPPIFDGSVVQRRHGRLNTAQPVMAMEPQEKVNELASKVTNRIDTLLINLFNIERQLEKAERKAELKVELKKKVAKEKSQEEEKSKELDVNTDTPNVASDLPSTEPAPQETMAVASSSVVAGPSVERFLGLQSNAAELQRDLDEIQEAVRRADAVATRSISSTEAQRIAPGLTNAQEEAVRPDLVMDSVVLAQRRREQEQNSPTSSPVAAAPLNSTAVSSAAAVNNVDVPASAPPTGSGLPATSDPSVASVPFAAAGSGGSARDNAVHPAGNQAEASSTDFAAVAARRAAAAGISLEAPANVNPEVVAAAIGSTGIDPAFLSALPEEVGAEILPQCYEQIRTMSSQPGHTSSQGATNINQDFLIALPPALRGEVLELEAEFQSRHEARNDAGNSNADATSGDQPRNTSGGTPTDMDPATFLATLAPELRESILLESSEEVIQSLPPTLAAEARVLRERDLTSRLSWRVNRNELGAYGFERRFPLRMRESSGHGGRGGRSQTREAPIYKWKKVDNGWLREGPNIDDEPAVSLQSNGLSALVHLLWLRQGHFGKTLLYQVLFHACKTTESRLLVLEQLLKLITSSGSREGTASSSSSLTRPEIDHARQHGTAVRRALEVLVMLCKNDAVIAESLLGLSKTDGELKLLESASLADEEAITSPKISLSTLVSLLDGGLFFRSNSHLEQLVSVISTVCQCMPSERSHCSSSDDRRTMSRHEMSRHAINRRTMSRVRGFMDRSPLSQHSMGERVNFFIVDNDGPSRRGGDEVYEFYDEENEDEEDSDVDAFDTPPRTQRETDVNPDEDKGGDEKEESDETLVPVNFRVPKLHEGELMALSKVLLRNGCSDRTYERASRAIGLLGELPCNRRIFMDSLVCIAGDAGRSMRDEYQRCIDSLLASSQADASQKRSDVITSFSVASISNELTLLRVVKSLSSLFRHEAAQAKEALSETDKDRPEGEESSAAVEPAVIAENPFRKSMLNGLQDLWSALDKLLELVSDEAKLKYRKQNKGEDGNSTATAREVLNLDRRRVASRGLSPVLARLSPMIEAFLVSHSSEGSQSSSDRTSPRMVMDPTLSPVRSPLSKAGEIDSESTTNTLDGELSTFVERHRGPINALLRANPVLLETSFKGSLRHPHAIDFDNKKAYFKNMIRQRSSESHASTIRISVRRDRVFHDSFHQLRVKSPEEMKGRLHVQFQGEEGVDAGGVTREWYIILARQIFDANYVLFTRSAAKAATYQPDKRSYIHHEHLDNFRFVGRIIGKAIYDGQLIDAYFTRSFYKHILGLKPTYHDLEAQDPEYYKSLKWMLENDCTGILDYTMSAEYDEFGKQTIIDLLPNGRNIPVTEENKADYVRLVTEVRMTKSIERQIEAFKEGFYELIPYEDCKIFNELELELLMSGLPDIDMADLKANVEYTGYTASSPQINWFWRCVGKMDQEDLARLVMFVTGTSKVPLEGFSTLQGMNGTQKFQIHRVSGNTMRLPSAHTCFNQLDLPEYSTAETLTERLLRAVRECSVGFGFA